MLSLKLPRLLNINQVPKVFREQGIVFGYRHPRSSAADCLLSVFQMTNETLNIWTHFVPACYFLGKLLALLCSLDLRNDVYAWPLLAYMSTCCIYPFTSSCAHTFSTMSTQARHICYFFDYGSLSIYSLGSAMAYSAYVFPEEWVGSTFHRCYVPTAVFNAVLSTGLSCYSRCVAFKFVHLIDSFLKSNEHDVCVCGLLHAPEVFNEPILRTCCTPYLLKINGNADEWAILKMPCKWTRYLPTLPALIPFLGDFFPIPARVVVLPPLLSGLCQFFPSFARWSRAGKLYVEAFCQENINCISTVVSVMLTNSTQAYPFLLIYRMIITNRLGAPYHRYNSDILERFPELEQPRFSKVLRTLAFAYPYLFDSIPLFYRLYLCAEDSCAEGVIPIHIQHVIFAFLTCFIFTTHLPERLAPGHFDYIGHSHQVFHVCGIVGTYFQMEAIMMDMASRHDRLRASFPFPTLSQTFGLIGICLVVNLVIIGAFSKALYSTPESSKREKTT